MIEKEYLQNFITPIPRYSAVFVLVTRKMLLVKQNTVVLYTSIRGLVDLLCQYQDRFYIGKYFVIVYY